MTFGKDKLEAVVSKCIAFSEIGRYFGIKTDGGRSFNKLKTAIQEFGIDTSHFLGQASRRGKSPATMLSKADVLKLLTKDSKVRKASLKLWLRKYGIIPHVCECGNDGWWRNKPLILQLDHKNGDKYDNRKCNLRWLCANCHTQTETFAGKNKRRRGGMADTLRSERRAERQ